MSKTQATEHRQNLSRWTKKKLHNIDYCYIDKVIRNKNGSKSKRFRIIKQSSNA